MDEDERPRTDGRPIPNGGLASSDGTPPADADAVSGLRTGRSRTDARELRDRLEPDERERVERTVAELLDLFGKAHALAVLSAFAFADGPLRFSELEADLEVPANTLSTRLAELVAAGLLRRESYDEVPPRVEYEPTEKGRAVFPAFGHLHVWAAEYELESVDD